jgi:hypothetical protein
MRGWYFSEAQLAEQVQDWIISSTFLSVVGSVSSSGKLSEQQKSSPTSSQEFKLE